MNGSTTKYTTLDGKVVRETWGNITTDYFYDNEGKPYKIEISGGAMNCVGYYVLNQQGDVIAILDDTGDVAVRYGYNAWGKVIDEIGTGTLNSMHLQSYNHLKYRGYYYDGEMGFYCLSSRYYDPEIGRFLNADDVEIILYDSLSVYNKNLYAYCDNNPANRIDIDGYMWKLALAGGGAMVLEYGMSMSAMLTAISTAAPVVLIVVTLAVVGTVAYDVFDTYRKSNKSKKPKAVTQSSEGSTPASPKPPNNNKGKGTKVTSKTLYSKSGKDGFQIDVENPGTRPGQIHIHIYGGKYFYDIGRKIFVNCYGGPPAPAFVQDLLKNKGVLKAIQKGLKILGY